MENPSIASNKAREHCSRELPPTGLFAYILDALCLPFQIFLRGRMGRKYFTYPKFLLSSLFFLLCLCLVQFRFETEVYAGPFTPGGFRPIPHIIFPETFLDFIFHLRKSFEIWTTSFTPTFAKLSRLFETPEALIYQIIALYYLLANVRFWLSKISERFVDGVQMFSSGQPKLLGILPAWDILGFYRIEYLLNFKTDMVKQVGEPLLLYLAAQYLLNPKTELAGIVQATGIGQTNLTFIGICCFFGSFFLALQAYVRSLPERRDNEAMEVAKYRNEAREAHLQQFNIFPDTPPSNSFKRSVVTRQPKP